ncbi:4-hydroxy-2-oxo-heptane-1,7-dioate aldolase [Psilocybe cubensis]|uniref:4-hydroxy-2-oxo-heptane-1,7-dioate aldolase n=1 Tax=Psilocybe cubensis TaxID=181762 RepID=A0ACB8H416_PSICU|nr:4-hydroxy-2-oxo-heptane-1,7-dioate aldolase [Psilocybe cubensis]KAH9482460.1 4-hydroxy-2-oxo-heptane-1,7-dioate aldolase [Psilocybe cubensis]
MNTFSRFIPSFASPPSASSNAQLRHGKPQQQFDHLARINTDDHVNAEFAGQWDADECEDELLGLQRVMADAQNPRRPVIGSWMMFPGANLARMVAQLGYDFILVDCEHGNIDDAAMHASVGAIAGEGVSPLVRIPKLDVGTVKRALDCGAHGILCPSISTVDDARALVSYSKFPATTKPLTNQSSKKLLSGIRGVGSPFAPSVFRQSLAEYIRTANRNTFIAIQIETTEGLSNCEEIAKVDGIVLKNSQVTDHQTNSPNDLASSMGYPPLSHESIPEVQEAIERILAAAHKAVDLMNLGGDVVALMEWNNEQLARLDDITGKKSTSAMYY